MRGADGFETGDTVELLTGEVVKIAHLYSYPESIEINGVVCEWRFYAKDENGNPCRFHRSKIKRMVQPVESVVISFTCPICKETSLVYKRTLDDYHGIKGERVCPDCFMKDEQQEYEKTFDENGYQRDIRLQQLFR